ncbi:hypothetical protein Leryth_015486 [Lithospermum erythrorhizon]|nr:hypothetical protein Leryth_015486 [Lithospermum erythrorhizon]
MKTLQKMIPNSSKTDKASMLDEVIEYLKQLQAQVHMVSRMNLPQMMLPFAMQQQQQQQQQQLQMAMMGGPMGMGLPGLGMGMGMGMGFMDMNTMARNNIPGMPPVLPPNAFMQTMTPWDGTGDRLPSSASPPIHDPLTAFLACQSQQPMTIDGYTRMASMFQQFQQLPGGPASTKN